MKRLSRPDLSAGETARLGEQLRDARIALGLSIEDMAASLRIRRVYLAALEEGRVRELPAPAYVLGFVRTYSRALGLDDDDLVRRFRDANVTAPTRTVDLVFPEPVPERGIPAGAVVMAGVVLVVGAYMAWFQWSGSGTRTVDTVPPMPARLEQVARETATVPSPPPLTGNLPASTGALLAGSMPPNVVRPVAPPPPGPPAAIAATAPNFNTTTQNTLAQVQAPVPRADESRITLRFKADSWFSLRDRNTGQTMVSRLMKAGETMAVPPREGLTVTLGFAPGVEFVVDGLPTPPVPTNMAVRKDIPMDAERLRAGNYNGLAPVAPVVAVGADGQPVATAPVAAAAPRPAPAPAPRPRPTRPEDRAYEPPQ